MYRDHLTLSVLATGAENLSYGWRKDGEDLFDANYTGIDTPILTIKSFTPDDEGKYSCIIKNCNSCIESEQADLALGIL